MRHGWLNIGGWLKRVREERELSRLLERDTERRRQRLREDPFGFSDGMVFVGAHRVCLLHETRSDLMAVFRDDAVTVTLDEPHGPELVISMPGRCVAADLTWWGWTKPRRGPRTSCGAPSGWKNSPTERASMMRMTRHCGG
jgi:hypothetical protein